MNSSSSTSSAMSVGFEDSALPYAVQDDDLLPDDFVQNPLHHVAVRYSDLTENSTRYDRLIAAPSNPDMQLMWLGWSIVTMICGLLVATVFSAVLLSPSRSKPFNVYLLCLMVPDLLLSVLCCWTCLENYLLGHYSSFWMCHFQSFYCIFCIASNAWLNAVVCHQLHIMLVSAGRFRRYKPPSVQQVLTHAAAVYAWSVFVASWTLWELFLPNAGSWWPHKTFLVGGVECLPMDFGVASTAYFYCVFFPCLMGIPLVYTIYLLYDILSHNRLPPKGKRRQLTIYFFRLVLVFVVMWLPGLLFLFITGQWLNPWVKWVGGTWCHVQGAASATVSLWKPDVCKSVQDLLTCQVWKYHRCCRKLFFNHGDLAGSSDFGVRRKNRRRLQRSNSSFLGLGSSFLGAFGRETQSTSGASLSGLSLAGSNADLMPFGSKALNYQDSKMLNIDQSNARQLRPFSSSSRAPIRTNSTSCTSLDLQKEKDDEDQYADDASAHLEDEYNVREGWTPQELNSSSRNDMLRLEAQRPSQAAILPVPQMVDTSSSNEAASSDNRQDQEDNDSIGLSIDDDDHNEESTANSCMYLPAAVEDELESGSQIPQGIHSLLDQSCPSTEYISQSRPSLPFDLADRRNSF